jgi:DNA topoisomerase I
VTETIAYVRDDQPGIRRLGTKRFRYVDPRGRALNGKTVARIKALAIPPAWTDVWICPDPAGHIQATGRDARGRKQYRYHARFRSRRERAKFRDLIPFGEALGDLRARVDADLRRTGLSRERVLAAVVSLMEQTFIRVGNESYAKTNKTFGLTTLRCRHVDVTGSSLHLHFPGKGGKDVEVACCDPRLARIARHCQDLPGQMLFQYLDDEGNPTPVTSTDLNEYVREVTGLDATAKTFRTWGATLLAAQVLVDAEGASVNELLRPVAEALGNTVAVCRNSYVHPTVLERYEDGTLTALWEAGPKRAAHGVSADERRLLHVLHAV